MTKVQVDDFECPICNDLTSTEIDMNTKIYTCLKCGTTFNLQEGMQNEIYY